MPDLLEGETIEMKGSGAKPYVIKNCGIGNGVPETGRARLTVDAMGERVKLMQGYTEMGQGLFTICIQVACEETGLDPRLFVPTVDTEHPLDCGMTTASRATVDRRSSTSPTLRTAGGNNGVCSRSEAIA